MRGVFVGTLPINPSFQSFDLFLSTQGSGVMSSLACMSFRNSFGSWGAIVASKRLLGVIAMGSVGLTALEACELMCRHMVACSGAMARGLIPGDLFR